MVRNKKLTARLASLAGNTVRLRRLIKRYENIVLNLISHAGKMRGERS